MGLAPRLRLFILDVTTSPEAQASTPLIPPFLLLSSCPVQTLNIRDGQDPPAVAITGAQDERSEETQSRAPIFRICP